jgi:hypothetical protein
MKTKMKKIMLGLSVALLGNFASQAQGLQGIIVEKYYQTNAADAANALAEGATTTLTPGSVVYRVYVDMAPNYKYNLAFGNSNHDWKINTTTNFFNDPGNGVAVGPQATSIANTKKNTVLIDSWLAVGGAASGKVGVLKIEDTDGSIGNSQGVLANNPGGVFGVAINSIVVGAQDGLATGTLNTHYVSALTALGTGTQTDIFDQTPGGTFLVNGGSIAALGGVVGTTTSNCVLIGQFTTDGIFGFEFNIQIQNTITNATEVYVANNPQVGETVFAGLTLAPNLPPTVGLAGPTNVITGNVVTFSATAADADGTVTAVQFKVDGVNLGTAITGTTGASSVYTRTWTSTVGSHTITAIATDDDLDFTTSNSLIIVAANNQAPIVTVAAPAGVLTGQVATFTATANDLDGTIASVTFSVDNVAIGTLTTSGTPVSPTLTWTATFGAHNVRASAIDNLGLVGTSAQVAFNIVNNNPPTVAIVSPINNANVTGTTAVVTISATAADSDGTVTAVTFYANNVSIGSVSSAPYTLTWTPSAFGVNVIKAVATDNAAGSTTSTPINVNVANPNALPYEIGAVSQQCNQGTFSLPISAASTYTVANVIGYDIVLLYNAAKVTPTGSITINSGRINPAFVDVVNSFASGTMNISASLNGSAPSNASFNGSGEIFLVNFVKNSMTEVDTAVYSIPSLDESYFISVAPQLVSNGRYTTFRDTTFNARLKFAGTNTVIAYDPSLPNNNLITNIFGSSAACVTNTSVAVQPNTFGDFVYNVLNGSSINISRDILSGTSVQLAVNGNDAFIGRQVVLNTASLTPSVYQIIALDVNLDGLVSSGDISQINLRSNLAIPEYIQAWNYNAAGTNTLGQPSKDWTFVDSITIQTNPAYQISTTYPLNNLVGYSKFKVPSTPFCLPVSQTSLGTCPTISDAVFRGIMLGDADLNWNSIASPKQFRPNGDKVIFDLTKSIVNGNTVEVPVLFQSSSPVVALNFAMKFDESNLSYNSMVNFKSNTDASAYLNPNDKTLRFTSYNTDLAAFSADQSVASIRFETKNGEVDASQFSSLLGLLNGESVEVEVKGNKTVGINSLSGDNSVSIYPNPTNGILNVTSISDATIQLFDVTGKEILLETTVNASKTVQVNVSDFSNGVYFVKIYNNDFVSIKKFVLNK